MGHGYVRNRFGCNCFYGDSSFKRYNRAHGDTVIFNYNWGNNGHCCGGTAKTGFWGGLGFGAGLGFGTGLMNMLGGWLGFGNGGFSMNGLFGGMSFPWGGATGGGWWGGNAGWGNGQNNGWNNGNNSKTNTNTTNKTTESTTPNRNRQADGADGTGANGKLNIDNPKFATISTKILELSRKTNPTLTEIKALEKELDDALNGADDIQTEDDKTVYNSLKGWLGDIKAKVISAKPTIQLEKNPTNEVSGATGASENSNPVGKTPTPAEGEVKIGETIIKIDDLTVDNLKKVTEPKELANIDENKAKDILTKLGYIDNNGTGKLSNIYGVLLLLEKSKVTVEVEHRSASSDQWIKGPISNVTKDKDGKLTYDVDCKGITGAVFEAKYRFTALANDNKTYKCEIVDKNGKNIKADNTIVLEYQNEKEPILYKSGKPLVKNN